MVWKALCGLASATLSSSSCTTLSLVYYIPATMALLLYFDPTKLFPASGPLHSLFPMLGHSESLFFHITSLSPHVGSSEGLSPDYLKQLPLYYHLCPIILFFSQLLSLYEVILFVLLAHCLSLAHLSTSHLEWKFVCPIHHCPQCPAQCLAYSRHLRI